MIPPPAGSALENPRKDASARRHRFEENIFSEILRSHRLPKQGLANSYWEFFSKFIGQISIVLDLGCGYGEFINNLRVERKYGMDLNPESKVRLDSDVNFLCQDCSSSWALPDHSLDVVFTSNFFEHLPDKASLGKTLDEVLRCLKPGGRLIAMGPNIKYLPGAYWDFWDHYVPLTELSLKEALENRGFKIERCIGRFLPYTMVRKRQIPTALIKLYLGFPVLWRFFGKQFLIVAHS